MAEDIWAEIARLRVDDMSLLSPVIRTAVEEGVQLCSTATAGVAVSPGVTEVLSLECRVVETLRVQKLQEIYFKQGTSKQRSALKSMHNYGVAVDIISVEFGWFTGPAAIKRWPDKAVRDRVAVQWFKAMANIITADKVMAWGGLWKRFPDSPHFQSAIVPDTPNDIMIKTYSTAGAGLAGRQAVWALFGLDKSPEILA